MEFAAATGTAANGGDSVLQAEPQDSWTGVVKITGTHTTRRLKKSDMSQESCVKKSWTIPNSQFPIVWRLENSEFLGNSEFFWGLAQRGCYSGFWKNTVTTLPSVTAKFGIFKKLEFTILKLD